MYFRRNIFHVFIFCIYKYLATSLIIFCLPFSLLLPFTIQSYFYFQIAISFLKVNMTKIGAKRFNSANVPMTSLKRDHQAPNTHLQVVRKGQGQLLYLRNQNVQNTNTISKVRIHRLFLRVWGNERNWKTMY